MERQGLNQPPLLASMDFAQWKLQMRSFIYGIDFHAWRSVERGWNPPMKEVDSKAPEGSAMQELKDEDEWTDKEIKASEGNHKALNALYASMSRDEKKRVQNCVTAKQVWDKLCVLNEGNDIVKEQRLQQYYSEIDALKMRDDETIDDFYSRFTDLSSLCESLGRPLQESDIVRKILRSLPKSYRMKKTTIQEQYNLNEYSVDLLIGNLKAWEMELDEDERPKGKNSKNIALKVTEPSKSKSEDSEHNEILLLTKEFKKFLNQKNNRNKQNNLNSRRSFNNKIFEKRSENFSQRKYEYGSSSNNNKKCYTCGGIGHIATDCGNKKSDSGNKAYKTSWSDDDDSSTKRDKTFALVSSFSLDYAGSENEDQEEDEDNSYEDNEMFEYQARVIKAAEKISEKNLLLKQQVEMLENEKVKWEEEKLHMRTKNDYGGQVIERKHMLAKIQMLQSEVTEKNNLIDLLNSKLGKLQVLLDGTNTKVEKFQHSSKSLSDILSTGKSYNDRTGLGYTGKSSSTKNPNFYTNFVREQSGSKECEKYIKEHVESEKLQTSFKSNIVNSNDRYEEDIQDIRSKLKEHSQLLLDISRFVGLSKSYKESKQDADMVRRPSGKKVWRKKYNHDSIEAFCNLCYIDIDYESNDIKATCNVAITALSARQEDTWYIDSGCSRHMCGNKHWFSDLEESGVTGAVTFGDGKKAKIRGKCSIRSQDLNCLNNVLYVEGLSNNLISVSQLADEYENVWFNKRRCVVFDKDGTVVMGRVRSGDNCYHVASNLKSDNSESCFRTSSVEETMELWHKRLGHLNCQDLLRLSSQKLVRGLPTLSGRTDVICGGCKTGKQTRANHKVVNASSSSQPLELLHMDLMGPSATVSMAGKEYIFVVVDDYSRFTWVDFLKDKSETFDSFEKLSKQLTVEKQQANLQIARIRSDNGTEFKNSRFFKYCRDYGVLHEFSAPITPQQNGIAERKNRSLLDMARVMLHSTGLSENF
ncbi:uncharacterized protein LOC126800215 [Argentina anserina]|uniref:uncharacterized protein LOC126800215 n=1 Tax=Argentina anserina TaxID=57926 RepID=UPI002176534C|nr:uncharacterized protein LOC126800215 [Potentilla anserina]